MRVHLHLMLFSLIGLHGCIAPSTPGCVVCGDTDLVPAAVPEFEDNPNGHAIFQRPVVIPIPEDSDRLKGPLPEDLARSADAVYARGGHGGHGGDGEWLYVFRVDNRGSRSAISIGRLYHHENTIVGHPGQVLETPWGRFQRLPFYGYTQGWWPVDQLQVSSEAP